jgi:hypothetical protein
MQKTIHRFIQYYFGDYTKSSRIRILLRVMAIGLGGLHTYAAIKSQSMNADGIAYLDIGDAYFRADWGNAINAVWSPLYSWILGLVNFIFKPSMQWEFPTVHIVNFLIFIFTLTSFEFMWSMVREDNGQQSELHRISPAFWWVLGYLLFIWTSLVLIQIWSVTPDMLMAGIVFMAAGLIAKIRAGDDRRCIFLILGLILGLGYLSKTFMFSIAWVFLGLSWIVQKQTRASLARSLLATSVFLLISLPFILLISNTKGKFTIGEAGSVTYLRYVNGMPFPHWQGDPQNGIVPTHPSRVVHQSPPVYEFGEPIGGTYPISTDPSYWYEGIRVEFAFRDMLLSLFTSSIYYVDLFFQKQGVLVACVFALYLMGRKEKKTFFELLKRWALVIPSIIAFGLYAMVLVQGRYIGVFVLLFWTDILANIRLPNTPNNRAWLNVISGVAAIGLLINISLFNLDGFTRLNPTLDDRFNEPSAPPAKPLAVAQALQELGIKEGDNIGVIGYAYDSFWARLARVKIAAEMLEADTVDLWNGDEALLHGVLQSFADANVQAVVAEYVPRYANLQGWYKVQDTNYYIYIWQK